MKQMLIQIDDELAVRLEKVAPSRSRLRSEFVRAALRKALWEIEERATAEAYRRQPDSAEDAY
jgi:metal-responsive CopG/Arc/MetJ family transcriptional regulator